MITEAQKKEDVVAGTPGTVPESGELINNQKVLFLQLSNMASMLERDRMHLNDAAVRLDSHVRALNTLPDCEAKKPAIDNAIQQIKELRQRAAHMVLDVLTKVQLETLQAALDKRIAIELHAKVEDKFPSAHVQPKAKLGPVVVEEDDAKDDIDAEE